MAIIFDIESGSFVDGPGIRTTIFFKGCNLRCAWCHNPESQSPMPQMMYFKDKCNGCGKCQRVCSSSGTCNLCGKCTIFCPMEARKISGKEYTPDEVWKEIEKDVSFFQNSGGGVTFSGGECMLQVDFLTELLKKCKEYGIHTAVDTAGYVPFSSFEKVLPYTDLFLYDIKCFDSEKHRQYVGVSNELILENLTKILTAGAKVWVRIPIIPSVNDTVEEMVNIREVIKRAGGVERVELLPYHAMGENKYRAIGLDVAAFSVPSQEKMLELKSLYSECF